MSGPRVLHVDTATEWRGGQQQLVYLLQGRPGDAWAGVPDGALAARLGPPTIRLRPGADPRNVLALRRGLARLGDVTLVAAHTPHAHGLGLLVKGLSFGGVIRPLVVHRRVDFAPRDPWKYRRADGIVAVSEGVRRVLVAAGVDEGAIRVVHDGVALREAGPLDPALARIQEVAGPRYLCAGALVPHKGHVHAVEAMVAVPGTLLLAGEGPLRGMLEARVHALGLSERVRFLGQVADLAALFAAVDVFVHPSVEEGMGQVVVEALGAGLRVVATTAGGIPEVVAGVGELVRPADPAALASAMVRAMARPPGPARERAAQFSVARMVAGTTAAYVAFLGASAR